MTTIPGMLPARPRRVRRRVILTVMFLLCAAIVTASFVSLFSSDDKPPNLFAGIDQVTCDNAREISDQLSKAVNDVTSVNPDYVRLQELGFPAPPVSLDDKKKLDTVAQQRQSQVNAIVASIDDGTCNAARPTATVEVAGKKVTLPVVLGGDPNNPSLGSDANSDPDTVPVSIGSPGEATQENSWTDLNNAYGDVQWYKDCAKRHLGVDWEQEVPRFEQVEVSETRTILAINVSSAMTDDEIRQRLSPENPDVDLSQLPVKRVTSIINTRHLEKNRCDVFVQTRSELRILTGVPQFDTQDIFTETDFSKGILNGCDNFTMTVNTPVEVHNPGPSTAPSTPTTTNPPLTTTPPGVVCKPGEVWNGKKCVESKRRDQGAAAQGNVPAQAQGPVPQPGAAEPPPANPPDVYTPPATTQPPTTTRTSVPPPPPSSEVTVPYDPCANPSSPACG